MRHKKDYKKLGRTSSHRAAMLSALVSSLILKKRITTTIAKAKEARRLAEKLVTVARKGTLQSRRYALSVLKKPAIVKVLFNEVIPQYKERSGGYTRIIKTGKYRVGDGSELAFLEWIGIAIPQKKKKKKADTTETTAA